MVLGMMALVGSPARIIIYCVGQRPAPDRYLEHTCVQAEQSKQSAP